MSFTVTVAIRENPLQTHRAVEALRIALGLSTGENDLKIVLLGDAPLLLTPDVDDVVDVEILEKYLPSFKQLGTTFVIPQGSRSRFAYDKDFTIHEKSHSDIHRVLSSSDRVLVF